MDYWPRRRWRCCRSSASRSSTDADLAALIGRAEAVLAVANLVWVLLLGLGLLAPTESLPGILAPVAAALPSGALGDAMRLALVDGGWPLAQWAVLAVWGVGAAVLASRTFRWSD